MCSNLASTAACDRSDCEQEPRNNPYMTHRHAADIILIALDVDGVLTDGSIYIDDLGHETKRFNVRDGFGLRLWAKLGFHTAIITGRAGEALRHRAAELHITEVVQGCKDKGAAIRSLSERSGVALEHIAFVGDDWPDASAMRLIGYPIAVADAELGIRQLAAYTTTRAGGHGAVREAIEHIISAKGLIDHSRAVSEGGVA